jgi:hypothetical protein
MFTLSIQTEVPRSLGAIVRALTAGLHPAQVNAAVGRRASQLTNTHIYGLANTRHRGNVSLNFYEDAADSVTYRDLGGGVELRVDKAGFAQRFYGGKIKAVNYPHLWIPIAEESEGKSAGEFDDLVPIVSALTNTGVALKDGEPLFALVPEVDQEADPTVLPTEAEYSAACTEAIDLLVNDLLSTNIETRPFVTRFVTGRDTAGRFRRVRQ